MTQTLIEKLESLHRQYHDDDQTPSRRMASDLRAIIEQYKTEGAEPVARMAFQGTFQMIADTKDKLPKQSQASAIPLFRHPSPDLVAELVKALERSRECLEAANNSGLINDTLWAGNAETLFDYMDAAIAKAKEMMG